MKIGAKIDILLKEKGFVMYLDDDLESTIFWSRATEIQ